MMSDTSLLINIIVVIGLPLLSPGRMNLPLSSQSSLFHYSTIYVHVAIYTFLIVNRVCGAKHSESYHHRPHLKLVYSKEYRTRAPACLQGSSGHSSPAGLHARSSSLPLPEGAGNTWLYKYLML